MSERRRRRAPWGCLGVVAAFAVLAGSCMMTASHLHFGPRDTSSVSPVPPSDFGTAREIGTQGDNPNPRRLYHGEFPSDDQTQERSIGGAPARFSGYTTWIRSVSRVPARVYVDGYDGSYVRARVTVFNRDDNVQHVCACDFYVWTRRAGFREADAVKARTVAQYTTMKSGTRRNGYVFLYVGHVPGPYFIVFDPDSHVGNSSSTARGVWEVTNDALSAGGSRSTPTAPRSTPG